MKLIRLIKSWFLPKHKGAFEYSPTGFKKAKRWAKNQPHPNLQITHQFHYGIMYKVTG